MEKLIQKKVDEVEKEIFLNLGENDILFIDSSHIVKIGSDVNYLFLQILPRLGTGVIVHFHDIFLPFEYPKKWVMENHKFFNEQYFPQTFLCFNSAYEILWGSHFMYSQYNDKLKVIFDFDETNWVGPGSFWIRRK